MKFSSRRKEQERGVAAVEYAALVALIAGSIIFVVVTLRGFAGGAFGALNGKLSPKSPTPAATPTPTASPKPSPCAAVLKQPAVLNAGDASKATGTASGWAVSSMPTPCEGASLTPAHPGQSMVAEVRVSNTGNSTITGITVRASDARAALACPANTLAPGAVMLCTTTAPIVFTEADASRGFLPFTWTAESADGPSISTQVAALVS